jgi:hypothetical protein
MAAPFGLCAFVADAGLTPGSWARRVPGWALLVGAIDCRLTTIAPHLLERNYNSMNRFFPAVSITILTSAFTNPTMF